MGPEIPDGSFYIFQRFREPGRGGHPIGDAGHHIALFRQVVPQLDPVVPVGVDEAAASHIDDGRHFFFLLGLEQIHGHGHIGIPPGRYLFIDHSGNLLYFRFHRSHLQRLAGVLLRRLRPGKSRHAQQKQSGQHQPAYFPTLFHRNASLALFSGRLLLPTKNMSILTCFDCHECSTGRRGCQRLWMLFFYIHGCLLPMI